MQINAETIDLIVNQVIKQLTAGGTVPVAPVSELVEEVSFTEKGDAKIGDKSDEVVIGISPAFGIKFQKTINDNPLAKVLRELLAGIEEQGLRARVVRVRRTADLAFIGHEAAKLSGSGVGIGIQSRGTTVVHQKDLQPLNNLELFPQSPVLNPTIYRAIGSNAAIYAKGESPNPVPVKNDQMARPKYQAKAALIHNIETSYVSPGAASLELGVVFR